ncbi:MAG: long-chain-fatty-acid--CoA ligase, partial [Pseudoxanthomonas sp.]
MSQDRPWFKSYPQGVPHEIDLDEYRSVVSVFDTAVKNFNGRPAFSNFGKILTYNEIETLSRHFAAYLLGELKLKKG